jgi:hypothetical protein
VCVALCTVFRLIVVLFSVTCVVCVLCLIVVPLPPGKYPFAVEINDNNSEFPVHASCCEIRCHTFLSLVFASPYLKLKY